ncbi:hypothetical protein D1871_05270 [Nakamurella silvestris]|nr:hypothetical protein D1871_05270 [Nakamurella silvestris]
MTSSNIARTGVYPAWLRTPNSTVIPSRVSLGNVPSGSNRIASSWATFRNDVASPKVACSTIVRSPNTTISAPNPVGRVLRNLAVKPADSAPTNPPDNAAANNGRGGSVSGPDEWATGDTAAATTARERASPTETRQI